MNEKRRDTHTGEDSGRDAECARSADLVTYLYGEATEEEARRFGQHLSACVTCREEAAAFRTVRSALGEWRSEALSDAPSLAASPLFQSAATVEPGTPEAVQASHALNAVSIPGKRSALVALRQFFALSPLWLRAGAVAATLVVCALSALVFARTEVRREASGLSVHFGVTERVVRETVPVPAETRISQARVQELLAERDRQLETMRAQLQQQQQATAQSSYVMNASAPSSNRKEPRATLNEKSAPRPVRGRRQPTRRFDIADNEESLPRLYDLLSEVN